MSAWQSEIMTAKESINIGYVKQLYAIQKERIFETVFSISDNLQTYVLPVWKGYRIRMPIGN